MNLDALYTRTQVTYISTLPYDRLLLNGEEVTGSTLGRVSALLDRVRQVGRLEQYAEVTSENNFPMGAGIASSASAFAALTMAACAAAGIKLTESELSRLARTGSGSACRSIPGGFVEWQPGDHDEGSYAYSIAPPDHWDLVDCVAILSRSQKHTSSLEGHGLADTSPLQAARIADAPRRLEICRRAIWERNFQAFAEVVELDCNLMHAVMLTSTPMLIYWQPATLAVIHAVQDWRNRGVPVCYTIDAGPNVHVLCLSAYVDQVAGWLREIPGVEEVLVAQPGGPTRLFQL